MSAVTLIEDEVREQLRTRAIDPTTQPDEVREVITEVVTATQVARARAGLPAESDPREDIKSVFDAVAGFGPLQPYLDDPSIEEVWLNEPECVS